jgi:hypothetical protein
LISLLAVELGCVTNVNTTQPSFISTPSTTPTPQNTMDAKQMERQAGMEIGNKIISAIEQYHEITGNYPNELSDLVPQYLEEIPFTLTGQEYQYVLYKPDFGNGPYVLYFYGVTGHWACGYSPKYDEWECGSGIPAR